MNQARPRCARVPPDAPKTSWVCVAAFLLVLPAEALRIGLLADPQMADQPSSGTRHYRDSYAKWEAALDWFEDQGVDLIVSMGDVTEHNSDPRPSFRSFDHYLVPGNHDYRFGTHTYFDRAGTRFIILDANYRQDGGHYSAGGADWTDTAIPLFQREWMASTLNAHSGPVVVFIHQCLDRTDGYGVKNRRQILDVLSRFQVEVIFQGHYHPGDMRWIDAIPIITLRGMVEGPGPENNAAGIADLDRRLLIGFKQQPSMSWSQSDIVMYTEVR